MKPDPPENVVARPVPSNPRRLEVTWQTPSTWPDPESFPLKFFLRYRPLILDQWQHVSALPCPAQPRSQGPKSEPHDMGGPRIPAAGSPSVKPEGSQRVLSGEEGPGWAWKDGWS